MNSRGVEILTAISANQDHGRFAGTEVSWYAEFDEQTKDGTRTQAIHEHCFKCRSSPSPAYTTSSNLHVFATDAEGKDYLE